jgi:hypothetical protein
MVTEAVIAKVIQERKKEEKDQELKEWKGDFAGLEERLQNANAL